jgi:hypothetical protein
VNLGPECEVVFVDHCNIRDGPGTCLHPSCRKQVFSPVNANEIVSRAAGSPSNLQPCRLVRIVSKLQWFPPPGCLPHASLSPSGLRLMPNHCCAQPDALPK